MLRGLLEVPSSTPYLPLLLETGMWTMEGRVNYKKLMLYHHIINSPDTRILKRLILTQMESVRKGTWYHSITLILRKYQLEDTIVDEITKSKWKKMVKSKINKLVEQEIRGKCKEMSKGRTVAEDKFQRKEYLETTTVEESKWITRMRLHMNKFPCNYGDSGECWLCGTKEVSTEHYFECIETELSKLCWNTKCQDMRSNSTTQLLRASKFLQLVEKKNV